MPAFSINDRVVAVNTDMTCAVHNPRRTPIHAFRFPDGPLEVGKVYNISGFANEGIGIFLTGKRVIEGEIEIPWHVSRFRKLAQSDCQPHKRRHRRIGACQPA